jgi:hypothetical protein
MNMARSPHRPVAHVMGQSMGLGKGLTRQGAYFVKSRDGKISEFSTHPDSAGMMVQLRLISAPSPTTIR